MGIRIPEKKAFRLSLEENARTSLVEGIKHFTQDPREAHNLKFAVLNIFDAVELFLKARLTEEHPLLIYAKPDRPIRPDSYTVCFDELVGRLKNAGVNLADNLSELEHLKRVRNAVKHHQIDTSEDVENYVGSAARFLEQFLREELNVELADLIDETTHAVLSEAIHSYDERLEAAKTKLYDELRESEGQKSLDLSAIDFCPECGEETISTDLHSESGLVECFFCHEAFFVQTCPRCGQTIFSSQKFDEDNDPGVCDDCWSDRMSND